MRKLVVTILFAVSALILMSGCSSDSASAPTTLTGTAATGAPIDGSVMVKDANGVEATIATTGVDGSFTLQVAGMTPPFLLRIMPGDGTATLYSYATEIGQTVNLTPTTNLAMFLASGKTDLDAMYAAWDGAAVTAAAVATAEGTVRANLLTQMEAAGLDVASFNLFTTAFSADGTGIDGVMDDLLIAIDAAAPLGFSFTNASGGGIGVFDETAVPPALPAPAGAISVVTVSGATHALNGSYKTACYINEFNEGQIDSLDVNGVEWVNSANVFSGSDCTGTLTISAITATITRGADKQISGWLDGSGVAPGRADGAGQLSDTETVTALSLVVTSVTGTAFSGVPVGFTANIFYVFDDTGSGFTMYRDSDELNASTTDPYIKR